MKLFTLLTISFLISCSHIEQINKNKSSRNPASFVNSSSCHQNLSYFRNPNFLEDLERYKRDILNNDIDRNFNNDDQHIKLNTTKLMSYLQGAMKDIEYEHSIELEEVIDQVELSQILNGIRTKKRFSSKDLERIQSIFYRAIYTKQSSSHIPIVSSLARVLKSRPIDQIEKELFSLSLKLSLEDYLLSIFPRSSDSFISKVRRFSKEHYNKKSIALATLLHLPFISKLSYPLYLPKINATNFSQEVVDKVLLNLRTKGWNETLIELETIYGPRAKWQRYYDTIRITYNQIFITGMITYLILDFVISDESELQKEINQALLKALEESLAPTPVQEKAKALADKMVFETQEEKEEFINKYISIQEKIKRNRESNTPN